MNKKLKNRLQISLIVVYIFLQNMLFSGDNQLQAVCLISLCILEVLISGLYYLTNRPIREKFTKTEVTVELIADGIVLALAIGISLFLLLR